MPWILPFDPYSLIKRLPSLEDLQNIIKDPKQAKELLLNEHLYAGIGVLTFVPIALKALKGFYYYLRSRSTSRIAQLYKPSIYPNEASWVVVTGATAGIGKAYCKMFAQEGFNVVAIARSPENLQALKTELSTVNPFIEIKTVQIDFAHECNSSIIEEKLKEVKELDISILVNNVGISDCTVFHELNTAKILQFVHVNVCSQVYVTKALINRLGQRSKIYRTAIVNISSNFGKSLLFPYFSVYSGTKAFNDSFSLALSNEYPNLDILSSRPGRTKSYSRPTGYDTDAQVRETVRFLGLKKHTHGPINHYLNAVWITRLYPIVKVGLRKQLFEAYDADDRKKFLKKPDLPIVMNA